jgi:16S rRNA (guanine1207-N2)-methyltransferase
MRDRDGDLALLADVLAQAAAQPTLGIDFDVVARLDGIVVMTDWRPAYDRWRALGIEVTRRIDPERRFPRIVLRIARHRERGLSRLALAFEHLEPGGALLVLGANDRGIKRMAKSLHAETVAMKHRARVLAVSQRPDAETLAAWRAHGALRHVPEIAAISAPGIFAWDRLDVGTALLVAHLPDDLAGRGADLGCGWGGLTRAVLARCPGVTSIDLSDADALALDAARSNLADRPDLTFRWQDDTGTIERGVYDWIVSNPPFHDRDDTDPEIGRRFIANAATALRPGGTLLLVANRRLPYEGALAAHFTGVERLAERDGYKVFRAVR